MKSIIKGKIGERDFIKAVYRLSESEIELKRNLSQTRVGGDDIEPYRNFSIEIKRWRRVSDALVRDWWEQCERNAKKQDKIPVLAFRADMQEWKIVLHPVQFFKQDNIKGAMTISLELFVKMLLDNDNTIKDCIPEWEGARDDKAA